MSETSAAPKTLMEAILRVQGEAPKLTKDAVAKVQSSRDPSKSYSYRYLTLDKLMDAVLPILNKYGLVWLTMPGHENGTPNLQYALVHAPSNERLDGTMSLMLATQDSQGLGSAISYARRYALTAVLGLAPDEDDDGAANKPRTPPAPKTVVIPGTKHDRLMTPEELEILGKAVNESGQKLSLLLASVGAEDLDALTVAQGRDVMQKISGSRK